MYEGGAVSAGEVALLEESEVESTLGCRLLELLEARSESEDVPAPRGRRSESPSEPRALQLCQTVFRRAAAIGRSGGQLARFSGSLLTTAEAAAGCIREKLALGAARACQSLQRPRAVALAELTKSRIRVPAVLESARAQLASGVTRSGRRRAEFARERRVRELQRRLETELAHTTRNDKDEYEAAEEWQWFSPGGEPADAGALSSAPEVGWTDDDDERSTVPGDAAVLTAEGHCDFLGLTSLVESRGAEFPEAIEEWYAYLHNLKPHVDSQGYLSPELGGLIASVFTPLLESPAGSA